MTQAERWNKIFTVTIKIDKPLTDRVQRHKMVLTCTVSCVAFPLWRGSKGIYFSRKETLSNYYLCKSYVNIFVHISAIPLICIDV